ncbi:hypothetical protein CAL65_13305 [Alkalilimnicola ehrlichii]|uniref:Uncharacterized protein n=1 Tax=Alkalilimnicola ehrlichii TaxID=351052 RepID=A0A3E0WQ57_9GAMM|nr:hypothetical protein [Alkalilimnicola ehrlichii]RFA35084.1 hypothetical protein CAL65_13305 [Alkalilimnicola ehrlichii]
MRRRRRRGGDFEVQASSRNSVVNQAKPTDNAEGEALNAISVTYVDTRTQALVDRGAQISAHDVAVRADTENSFTTQSTVGVDADNGVAGVSFALSWVGSETEALLGADLIGVNDVTVVAETLTDANVTQAVSKIAQQEEPNESADGESSEGAQEAIQEFAAEQGQALLEKIAGIGEGVNLGGGDDGGEGSEGSDGSGIGDYFKLAGSLAIADSSQTSRAQILDGTTIEADGDVAVVARVEDSGVRNSALSSVAAKTKDGDGEAGNTNVTTSLAINVANHRHNAVATIGNGVNINAQRVGVGAETLLPLNAAPAEELGGELGDIFSAFTPWADVQDIFSWLGNAKELMGDLPDEVFTSTANSTGNAENLAVAGSVNFFNVDQNSQAWIGDGAVIETRAPDDSGWTTALAEERDWAWSAPLAVSATNRAASINVAGNFDWLKVFGTGGAGDGNSAALGGSFLWNQYDSRAVAGIGEGVTIRAEAVDVEAESFHQFVAISPSAGNADGLAGNGTFAISRVNAETAATISNTVDLQAERLGLNAHETLAVWTTAGALGVSENIGAGASIAVNDLVTVTRAQIGDNRADSPFHDPDNPVTSAEPGVIAVNTLEVGALTEGQAGTFAVAGAAVTNSDPNKKGFVDRSKEKLNGKVEGIRNKAADLAENIPLLDLAVDDIRGKKADNGGTPDASSGDNAQSKGPDVDLAATGSVGINLARQETRSTLEGVTVRSRDEDVAVDTTVRALNETLMLSTAGAGSLVKAGNPSDQDDFKAALAGSVAINVLQNDTEAAVLDSTLEDAGAVRVQAMSAGDQVAVGLGLAVEASGSNSGDKSMTAAGSGSVNWTANQTTALVAGSTITGADEAATDVDVTAYDRTRIATGGGALFAGGKGGFGAALSLSNIGNTTSARIEGSEITHIDALSVQALAQNRIIGGGAVLGISTEDDSASLAGSLVFNLIGNTLEASIGTDEAGNGSRIEAAGDVTVVASDAESAPELDALTSDIGDSDVDFTASNPELPEDFADIAGSGSAIIGVAGAIQAGKADNVGLSMVFNRIANRYTAEIDGSSVMTGGDVEVAARDTSAILGLAVGGGVTSGKFAGMGSVSANVLQGITEARIHGDNSFIQARDLDVAAITSGSILSFAGNVAFSTKTAAGAAVSFNLTGGLGDEEQVDSSLAAQTVAEIDGATLELEGDLDVRAARQAQVLSAAAGGVVGTGAAGIGGSLNVTTLVDRTYARVSDSTVEARHMNIEVGDADLDEGQIFGGAGNVSFSKGTAIGAAFSVNTISSEREAVLADSTVELSGDATVAARYNGEISSVAVAGGGGGKVAAGASVVTGTIAGHSLAAIDGGSLKADSVSVDVSGDNLTINTLAGNVQGAGTTALGLASSVNTMSMDRIARVDGAHIEAGDTVDILSGGNQTIRTAAASGGGAGTAAVGGSASVNTIEGTESALLLNSTVIADSLNVKADSGEHTIASLAGNVQGAGTAAVGAATTVNTLLNSRRAVIEHSRLSVDDSITVRAELVGSIDSIAASGGVGGTAGVGGSVTTNVIQSSVEAGIRGSSSEHDSQTTLVQAVDSSAIRSIAGAAQGGGSVGIGPPRPSITSAIRLMRISSVTTAIRSTPTTSVSMRCPRRIFTPLRLAVRSAAKRALPERRRSMS